MKPSRYKLGALFKLCLGYPSTLSSMLTLLQPVPSHMVNTYEEVLSVLCLFEGGDRRCVHASWTSSTKHSILSLLLNPPLVISFIVTSVLGFLKLENVAHFFPLHRLHLDLMFLCTMIVLTFVSFQGLLKMVVYRLYQQGLVRFISLY